MKGVTVVLETKDLTKEYGYGSAKTKALNNVSIQFDKGDLCAITGKSGSGKSTLLRLLGGLDKPSYGSVYYDKTDIYQLNDREISKIRRQVFGFVFQQFELIDELTAEENIILPCFLDGKKPNKQYISELAEVLGLKSKLNNYPSQLSGGQQQRVAIARALLNSPEIILCDEPTGNLDKKTADEVINLIYEIHHIYNKTIIIITHDIGIAHRCDRIIEISDGIIISAG